MSYVLCYLRGDRIIGYFKGSVHLCEQQEWGFSHSEADVTRDSAEAFRFWMWGDAQRWGERLTINTSRFMDQAAWQAWPAREAQIGLAGKDRYRCINRRDWSTTVGRVLDTGRLLRSDGAPWAAAVLAEVERLGSTRSSPDFAQRVDAIIAVVLADLVRRQGNRGAL